MCRPPVVGAISGARLTEAAHRLIRSSAQIHIGSKKQETINHTARHSNAGSTIPCPAGPRGYEQGFRVVYPTSHGQAFSTSPGPGLRSHAPAYQGSHHHAGPSNTENYNNRSYNHSNSVRSDGYWQASQHTYVTNNTSLDSSLRHAQPSLASCLHYRDPSQASSSRQSHHFAGSRNEQGAEYYKQSSVTTYQTARGGSSKSWGQDAPLLPPHHPQLAHHGSGVGRDQSYSTDHLITSNSFSVLNKRPPGQGRGVWRPRGQH